MGTTQVLATSTLSTLSGSAATLARVLLLPLGRSGAGCGGGRSLKALSPKGLRASFEAGLDGAWLDDAHVGLRRGEGLVVLGLSGTVDNLTGETAKGPGLHR